MRLSTINLHRRRTIRKLVSLSSRTGRPLWRRVAELLDRPRRKRISVNLSKINRYANEGDVVIIPGRVLASGSLQKKLKIIAESFSEKAVEKIIRSGSEYMLLEELVSSEKLIEEIGKAEKKIIA